MKGVGGEKNSSGKILCRGCHTDRVSQQHSQTNKSKKLSLNMEEKHQTERQS